MNDVFQPFMRRFVLVFFNDILVYSKSTADHLRHIHQVRTILKSHQLLANAKKSVFYQPKIEYLGHIINTTEVSTDPAKIQAMVG